MVFFALVILLFPEPELIDKKAKKSDDGKPSAVCIFIIIIIFWK